MFSLRLFWRWTSRMFTLDTGRIYVVQVPGRTLVVAPPGSRAFAVAPRSGIFAVVPPDKPE
jgi:hypothetical protein